MFLWKSVTSNHCVVLVGKIGGEQVLSRAGEGRAYLIDDPLQAGDVIPVPKLAADYEALLEAFPVFFNQTSNRVFQPCFSTLLSR